MSDVIRRAAFKDHAGCTAESVLGKRGPEMAPTGKSQFRKEKWLLLRLQGWWWRWEEEVRPTLHFRRRIISRHLAMDWLSEHRRGRCQRRSSASCPMELRRWSSGGKESRRGSGLGGSRSQFHLGQDQPDTFKPLVTGVWRSEERSELKYKFGRTWSQGNGASEYEGVTITSLGWLNLKHIFLQK